MSSAAAPQTNTPATSDQTHNLYLRAVWSRLAAGAFAAARIERTASLAPLMRPEPIASQVPSPEH